MQNFIDHKACYTEAIKMMEKYKQMEQLMEKKMQEMNDKVEKEIEEIKKEYTEIPICTEECK